MQADAFRKWIFKKQQEKCNRATSIKPSASHGFCSLEILGCPEEVNRPRSNAIGTQAIKISKAMLFERKENKSALSYPSFPPKRNFQKRYTVVKEAVDFLARQSLFRGCISNDKKREYEILLPAPQAVVVKYSILPPTSMPPIRAFSYIVLDHQFNILASNRHLAKLQIASLTKLMTCYLVILTAQSLGLNLHTHSAKVSKKAVFVPGTKAGLLAGETIFIWDLLHALMLPSGNDAALVLSVWCGKKLSSSQCSSAKALSIFVDKMNSTAKRLGLQNTVYMNPHGLANNQAFSTCQDVAVLSHIAARNARFAQIVGCTRHVCQVTTDQGRTKQYVWTNTNKLLWLNGFKGLKTGVTSQAGPCLAASFQRQGLKLVVVLLRTTNLKSRFEECKQLVKYCLRRMGLGHDFTQLDCSVDAQEAEEQQLMARRRDEHRRKQVIARLQSGGRG